ncbi:MAG: hypothetical protein VKI81_07205, partial [Synechococcaceae cyanobacterium]|nr:hypothetical protein [Synechococcaceae cyanobacterium]
MTYLFQFSFLTDASSTGGAGNLVEGTIELMEGNGVGAGAGPSIQVTKTPNNDLLGDGWSYDSGGSGFNVVNGEVVFASAVYTRLGGSQVLGFGTDCRPTICPQLSDGSTTYANRDTGASNTFTRV